MLATVLLGSLPWIALVAYVLLRVREPPPLPPAGTAHPSRPLVSVIVPARNEAHNIARCVGSIVTSAGVDLEVIVVDDRSEDGTGDAARAGGAGCARRLVVLDGTPLPDGWFGKQWACWQGAHEARGDLLLFTDADTVHGPALLERAVAGLDEAHADALTVIGRQIMGSFWERLVQPQIFTLLALRYPNMGHDPLPQRKWRSAISNGQYLLFRRAAYEELGGHEAVRYEAAEDLRLAQRLVRAGRVLAVRSAFEDFGTRMYRGLRELIAGWSKNMMQAGLQTVPPWIRPVAPALMFAGGAVLLVVPPAALIAALAGVGGPALLPWATTTTSMMVVLWMLIAAGVEAPWWIGPLYPLGSMVGLYILLKSWLGKGRVRWKGRSYAWDVYSDVREDEAASADPAASRTGRVA
jgi:chlorobactene glucosyltransferase